MKIAFLGGGTGGHFYPLIAIAEAIREKAKQEKILQPELYFIAPNAYNPRALYDNEITFIEIPAGKYRRYFSLLNITDLIKTFLGIIKAFITLYNLYPDVIFSKGGFGSFPSLVAAKFLRIPVIIHESDSVPGIVSTWSAHFARKIAVSYPNAAEHFKKKDQSKIAHTGNPVRKEIMIPLSNGAHEFLNLEEKVPTILVLGGSQGSQIINDTIIDSLGELLNDFQVLHQTGKANLAYVQQTVSVTLKNHPQSFRYHPFDYMNDLALRMAAGVSNIIISRAGSTIFEIAQWGIPSIIIPINQSISHDQTKNAFSYARSGACSVIEEHNLSSTILISEVRRILTDQSLKNRMGEAAKSFAQGDAAVKIATAILEIGLEHEK